MGNDDALRWGRSVVVAVSKDSVAVVAASQAHSTATLLLLVVVVAASVLVDYSPIFAVNLF